MKKSSHAFAGATEIGRSLDTVPFGAATQRTDAWRLAQAAHVDLRALGMPHVNLLLIGADDVTQSFLETLLMDLREPISHWCAGEPLVLPPAGRTSTLILHDVGAMPMEDQRRLLRWLEQAVGKVQVISTTPVALLTCVQNGTFVDTLYYRLNTVCLDIGV